MIYSSGSSLLAINNIVKSSTKKINTKYELKDVSNGFVDKDKKLEK